MNTDAQHTTWVLAWQKKLHRWAVESKQRTYQDIYNLAYDRKTLQVAWDHIRANKGSKTAGIDGQTRYSVERRGIEKYLEEIHQDLKSGTYRPQPVREKGIPKKSGKIRYLGIPTLRDRVVQQALRMVLEPIFEADFDARSYGYRPGRRAHDAIKEILQFTKHGVEYPWVVEGDIQGCFDNVHHGVLLEEIRRRVTDRKVLRLVRAFLTAGVMTELGSFRRSITGTPQGGIVSPLLANIYLNRMDQYFRQKWEETRSERVRQTLRKKGLATSMMVRFADDFVILLKGTREQAESLKEEAAQLLRRDLHMELSQEKTLVTHISQGFDFLGYHLVFQPDYHGYTKMRFYPSKKSLQAVQAKVRKITSRSTTTLSVADLIGQLNPVLRGWSNYFRFAHAYQTFSYLNHYTVMRVYRWLRKKHHGLPAHTVKRKYLPHWVLREGKAVLFDVSKARVGAYGYRGIHIPSPWNQGMDSISRTRLGDRLSDETRSLELLADGCAI